jgi:hypothetical protein
MIEGVEEFAKAGNDDDRQRRRRRQATICYGILSGMSLLAAFSTPWSLLWGIPFGVYAFYLHQGGSVILWSSLKPRVRSRAWIYYSIIAIGGLIAAFSHPITLLVAVIAGAYATYLYRGGRWVLWIW